MENNRKTEFESAHSLGAATKIIEYNVSGVPHVLIPPNSTLQSLEKYLDAPIRIKSHPQFNDVEGFADYIEEFKDTGSRIFVDDVNHRFITVFDCHAKDKPAHGDHSASMKLDRSSEWIRFCDMNGTKMKPTEFAEFLEDNIEYLSENESISGADLLTMAQKFKINLKGDVECEDSLQAGVRKLVLKDDSVLRGKTKDGRELEFPEKIAFDLRIFKNHDAYPIKVYLRYRASTDMVTFWIKIPDIEKFEEQAFTNVIGNVKEASGLKTLKGTYEGFDHRR